MKNISEISKQIKTTNITVDHNYSIANLEVVILAEYTTPNLKIILTKIGEYYQDFWIIPGAKYYKPLTLYGHVFADSWDKLNFLPIFKDFAYKLCTYRFIF